MGEHRAESEDMEMPERGAGYHGDSPAVGLSAHVMNPAYPHLESVWRLVSTLEPIKVGKIRFRSLLSK
jgi:hypothetical protein